jgi:hypothetical protein
MKNAIKTLIILFICFGGITELFAQEKVLGEGKYRHTASDSLFTEFSGTVYNCYYTPSYMSNSTPTFAMLKIDIDPKGKVTSIQFSDSADSTFVKAFVNRKKWHNDEATLEKYAKIKGYSEISLLIPVSWEPKYPYQKKIFTYEELEGLMKFNSKNFTGKSIIFSPIHIKLSSSGNM